MKKILLVILLLGFLGTSSIFSQKSISIPTDEEMFKTYQKHSDLAKNVSFKKFGKKAITQSIIEYDNKLYWIARDKSYKRHFLIVNKFTKKIIESHKVSGMASVKQEFIKSLKNSKAE